MNQAITQAITSVIPNKMARHRWRGILRYGPIRAIKLKSKLRKGKSTPTNYYLAVCALAKNEGSYFEEWINWHRKIGVEKFYIYDNESSDNTKEVLAPYIKSGLVEYTFWNGKKQQWPIYDDCIERHRFDAHWIAFIDLDEFIIPKQDETIPTFLKRFEQFSAIEINWLIYGSGGEQKRSEGPVMDRFKMHALPDHRLNRYVKNIVNPRRVFVLSGAHEAAKISGSIVDSHGIPVKKVFKERPPQHDIIRINHYAIKSYEEFLEKRARGRCRSTSLRDMSYFEEYDLNDITEE